MRHTAERRASSKRPALVLFVAGSLLAPFVLFVVGRLEIVQTSYEMHDLERRVDQLQRANRALLLEREALAALPRIEREARRLGLEPLPLDRLIVVRPAAKLEAPVSSEPEATGEPEVSAEAALR